MSVHICKFYNCIASSIDPDLQKLYLSIVFLTIRMHFLTHFYKDSNQHLFLSQGT